MLLPVYQPTRSHIREDRDLPRVCGMQNAYMSKFNADPAATEEYPETRLLCRPFRVLQASGTGTSFRAMIP